MNWVVSAQVFIGLIALVVCTYALREMALSMADGRAVKASAYGLFLIVALSGFAGWLAA